MLRVMKKGTDIETSNSETKLCNSRESENQTIPITIDTRNTESPSAPPAEPKYSSLRSDDDLKPQDCET